MHIQCFRVLQSYVKSRSGTHFQNFELYLSHDDLYHAGLVSLAIGLIFLSSATFVFPIDA